MASAASCHHYGRKLTKGDSYQSVCLVAHKEYRGKDATGNRVHH